MPATPTFTKRPKPDSRREAVLSSVIEEYLVTGEAVGSHAISDKFAGAAGWSSATIRNVMAELEELGLLEQPHTSAGRIPTDKGYRYYVDHLPGSRRLSAHDMKVIENIGVDASLTQPDRLMEKASHVLSQLSNNVGIIVWPSFAENRLKQIRFMKLPDNRVLVVLLSASNIVHDKVISLDENFTQDDLDRTSRYLNEQFAGKTLVAIRAEIMALISDEKALYDAVVRNAILLCERSLEDETSQAGDVFVEGAFNIFGRPEFSRAETMRELIRTLEEKSRLIRILNECVGENFSGEVRVVIGRENPASAMQHCAVISTSYQVGADIRGTLGVVGPTRIEYGRIVAVVNYLARFIERAFISEASIH